MGWMIDSVGRLIARLQRLANHGEPLTTIRRAYGALFDQVTIC